MKMKRFFSTVLGALMGIPVLAQAVATDIEKGVFEPSWQSLAANYQAPQWFADAKLGIWAHWGLQCVPEAGDWYARAMYQQDQGRYREHCKRFGHPSEFGMIDFIPMWKAEKFDPEALVKLYKEVGARYFVCMANHHDNFDNYRSKYHPWNSVNMGPKRDIVGEFEKAARRNGLRFGVSNHSAHAWHWFQTAYGYDAEGEKAGVRYDAYNLTKEDGKGKWWEGFDPQQLYQQQHPMSERAWWNGAIHQQWDWTHGAAIPSQEFVTNFYDRSLDAINRYQPDLIYFDATVLPFHAISDCGLKIVTHLYNRNPRAVVFGKILDEQQRKALTWDVERGAPNYIVDEPWQTCNCIGGWHYNTSIYERGSYKSAAQVVKMLVDIVSKNGNLLLSIPLRADGTYDEKEAVVLDDLEAWMTVNGESIFGTRPWRVFGEGPVAEKSIALNAQGFNDGQYSNMDYRDIRFNQKGKVLYVTAMSWPDNHQLVIKSLRKGNPYGRKVGSVKLLGCGRVKARQTKEGLVVTLPAPCNKIAPVLKVE